MTTHSGLKVKYMELTMERPTLPPSLSNEEGSTGGHYGILTHRNNIYPSPVSRLKSTPEETVEGRSSFSSWSSKGTTHLQVQGALEVTLRLLGGIMVGRPYFRVKGWTWKDCNGPFLNQHGNSIRPLPLSDPWVEPETKLPNPVSMTQKTP